MPPTCSGSTAPPASRRGKIGKGQYQSAYWPSLGGLVAVALARTGRRDMARSLVIRMGGAIVDGGDIREWYGIDGIGQGARYFQWGARMYLVALCAAYAGVDLDAPRGMLARSVLH
jgi:hypothetical protein